MAESLNKRIYVQVNSVRLTSIAGAGGLCSFRLSAWSLGEELFHFSMLAPPQHVDGFVREGKVLLGHQIQALVSILRAQRYEKEAFLLKMTLVHNEMFDQHEADQRRIAELERQLIASEYAHEFKSVLFEAKGETS